LQLKVLTVDSSNDGRELELVVEVLHTVVKEEVLELVLVSCVET
jgi:hypothetical protein